MAALHSSRFQLRITVRTDGKGRGVYRFSNTGCALGCPENAQFLVRLSEYTLRIQLPDGNIITGATTIPSPLFRPDTAPTRIYDRERERYTLEWNPSSQATKRFSVQIQTPYGPFELFTADASINLSGDLRNLYPAVA